jgi:hypothetical protein
MNILLWIIQVLLALVFLFSGGMKLLMSVEAMQKMSPPNSIMMAGWFIKFIGVCEVLGALGLILPGLLRRQQYLTVLSAIGLLIIVIGAVVVTLMGPGGPAVIFPLVIGLLCAFVAYGRRGANR